jgi:AraC-like DNA-binding protein
MSSLSEPDALSDVFEQVEVRGLMAGGFAVRGPWVSRGPVTRPFKLAALVAGSARLSVDGPGGPDGPIDLRAGDVVLLNHRTRLEASGGGGGDAPVRVLPESSFDTMALAAADPATDDVLVGGWIEVNAVGEAVLGAALPSVVHVRSTTPDGARLAALVGQLFREASSTRLGSAFAIRHTGQLILLGLVRAFLEQERPPVGWLRLLADDALAPAVRLMHERPGDAWTLVDLARAAGMSRTGFAERFRSVAGVPPVSYLTAWRMVLAQRALRDPDVRIGRLAFELGFGSESAFSTAFKREVGVAPSDYRRRLALGA